MKGNFAGAVQTAILGLAIASLWLNVAEAVQFRRELSTDRPDKTESPYTVETGGFQFELNLASLRFQDTELSDSRTLKERHGSFGGILKYGLASDIDLQFVVGYEGVSSWIEGSPARAGQSKFPSLGIADPGLRLKINLTGNDGGSPAVALMPYIFIPVGEKQATADDWQGGLIIPAALETGSALDFGFMVELDALADEEGHHPEFVTSATTAFGLLGSLRAYLELFQQVDLRGDTPWEPTFDTGFTYGIGANMQLDLGINIGLNGHADDFSPFLGFSFRL
jgi:hypothetical protein